MKFEVGGGVNGREFGGEKLAKEEVCCPRCAALPDFRWANATFNSGERKSNSFRAFPKKLRKSLKPRFVWNLKMWYDKWAKVRRFKYFDQFIKFVEQVYKALNSNKENKQTLTPCRILLRVCNKVGSLHHFGLISAAHVVAGLRRRCETFLGGRRRDPFWHNLTPSLMFNI